MNNATHKRQQRIRRHNRVRARVEGTSERPRLAVFRSNKYLSAQLIDDVAGKTLFSAHGREVGGTLLAQAVAVGKAIAERAKAGGIEKAVFDRGGYLFTGRVKALADSARENGLTF